MKELLPILHGYCTIQLVKKVGGSNRWPHTIRWEICGNVLIDEHRFLELRKYNWLRLEEPVTQSYYAYRTGYEGGRRVHIHMAREILNLPHGVGFSCGVGDHENHDIRDYSEKNLRIASQAQNTMNRTKWGACQRFKGVCKGDDTDQYTACIYPDGSTLNFPSVPTDVEAALLYNYTAGLIYGEFAYLNVIPEDEMPTVERQWNLWDMVIDKLRQEGIQVKDVV